MDSPEIPADMKSEPSSWEAFHAAFQPQMQDILNGLNRVRMADRASNDMLMRIATYVRNRVQEETAAKDVAIANLKKELSALREALDLKEAKLAFSDCVASPFAEGDRIRYTNNPSVGAVVTGVTPYGFKYKLDQLQVYGHPLAGTYQEGEVYSRSWYPHGGFELDVP